MGRSLTNNPLSRKKNSTGGVASFHGLNTPVVADLKYLCLVTEHGFGKWCIQLAQWAGMSKPQQFSVSLGGDIMRRLSCSILSTSVFVCIFYNEIISLL